MIVPAVLVLGNASPIVAEMRSVQAWMAHTCTHAICLCLSGAVRVS